ncbi:CAAX prenyl protease 2 isoform X2 [Cajanus cajan]|uniref:CAAX prenyl protease 2 isoform X2 n=1 Tax=Cajanus cajan TaxID=3821 RepID=UPI00098DC1EA|nr:CAAX prenyl protease 2 isoform X2 [Cajanus cajan]
MEQDGVVSKAVALIACVAMALFYVAILYAPTVVLRLPPPPSFKSFMIRRFLCAVVSSFLSLFLSALILPTKELRHIFGGVFGIRGDHIWQAVVIPLCLTSLMYAGSMFLKCLLLLTSWRQHTSSGDALSFASCKCTLQRFFDWLSVISSNVLVWRNYVVAPITEELVFRACMIPLLLCGGFKAYSVILLCPIFFSLAHLNHFVEIYTKQNYRIMKAVMIIGLQLGYTVVFGSYASFLFIRTGHLIAPLVAHIYCNFMGLPALYSQKSGFVSVTFIIGFLGFLWLLFPMTGPDLYNDSIDNCSCWQGYCTWIERIRI